MWLRRSVPSGLHHVTPAACTKCGASAETGHGDSPAPDGAAAGFGEGEAMTSDGENEAASLHCIVISCSSNA